jgi:hypothetical protein
MALSIVERNRIKSIAHRASSIVELQNCCKVSDIEIINQQELNIF